MSRRVASALTLAGLVAGLLLVGSAPAARAAAPTQPLPAADLGIPLPVPIPGVGGPCDIPGVDRACSAVGGVLSKLPNPITGAIGFVAGEAEKSFTHWLADAAASLLGDVLRAADTTLQPDVAPGSFVAGRLQSMLGLAGGISLLFLLFAVGQGLLRGDPGLIVRSVCIRLPIAFLATGVLLFVTATVIAVVDQATATVIGGGVQQSAATFMQNLSDAFRVDDFGGVSLALVALCALGTILIGILLYAEFAVRTAVIYLTLLFMPLGLAASVWQGAGRLARRLADILVAAILAKFVILVSLWFAAGLLEQASSTGGGSGFGNFVVGLVILFVAAASPLVLLSLVAHADEAVAAVAGVRQVAYAPPQRAFSTVQSMARTGAIVAAGGGPTTAIAGGAGGASGARGPATRGPIGGGPSRPTPPPAGPPPSGAARPTPPPPPDTPPHGPQPPAGDQGGIA